MKTQNKNKKIKVFTKKNKYINFLQKNKYSINTIKTYWCIISKYQFFLHDIRLVKKEILKHSNQPNTAWLHYNVILSYLKFSKDTRIFKLQELKLPPIPIKFMPVFSKSFLMKKTSDLSKYKNVIIRFLFETGIRANEIYNILEIKKQTLIIKGKGSKIREIFHNPETTKLLKKFNFTTKTLRLWVKEVLGKKFTPHSIRRSLATHLLLKGANPKMVMLQLGHAKLETTYKYLQMSKANNLKIYKKYL